MDKSTQFISWERLSDGLLFIVCGGLILLWKLLAWVFSTQVRTFLDERSREIADLRQELKDVDNKIQEHSKEMHNKVIELSEWLSNYRKHKHDIQNENAGLKGSLQICNEALNKAQEIINKYEGK